MPHVVQLHHKYADDGLRVITVSLDSTADEGKIRDYLKQQRATFENYLLDEEFETIQEHWQTPFIPAYFVFDQGGDKVGKFTMNYTFDDIEGLVRRLLMR